MVNSNRLLIFLEDPQKRRLQRKIPVGDCLPNGYPNWNEFLPPPPEHPPPGGDPKGTHRTYQVCPNRFILKTVHNMFIVGARFKP